MAATTISRDLEAVRTILSYWLYRAANKDPAFTEAMPDLAAEICVSKELSNLQDLPHEQLKELCISQVFGAGVTLGIAATLAVLDDPFSVDPEQPGGRINEAIKVANKELRVLADLARRNARAA